MYNKDSVYTQQINISTSEKLVELARLFPSPYGHIELSLASAARTVQFRTGIVPGFSAPAPQQRNYCYAEPQTAYDELFKSVTNSKAVDSENSMLDYLQEKEKNLKQLLNCHWD